ncbi:hypothetical protein C7N43_35085 [Sphingobacteriales bacterium UPWRP_1]|nr:hypothetical protein C7N43_35085 [Sphingobacteriales bacterium UPWRP_1]
MHGINLDNFFFESSDHLRYQNGVHVAGPHGGARRAVKIEPNINGGEGYTVTIFNLDGLHPFWQNNIQMAPKQMKVVTSSDTVIGLRGYGSDSMGASFSDYGISIRHLAGKIEKVVLHMYDRQTEIHYLP